MIHDSLSDVWSLLRLQPRVFSSRRRHREKELLWDDDINMEPTFSKFDTDEKALSATNPTYMYNGGKLEINSP